MLPGVAGAKAFNSMQSAWRQVNGTGYDGMYSGGQVGRGPWCPRCSSLYIEEEIFGERVSPQGAPSSGQGWPGIMEIDEGARRHKVKGRARTRRSCRRMEAR